MFGFDTIPFLTGLLICAIAALPVLYFVGQRVSRLAIEKSQFAASQQGMREEIRTRQQAVPFLAEAATWQGYRDFRVSRIERESSQTTSLYLMPEDGKPFPGFRPGQHITVRVHVKGRRRPTVRCYSLSGRSGDDYYRISVRQILANENKSGKPGVVSSWLNEAVKVGDRIEVKAPSGSFVLNEESDMPIVLLAAVIGITPLLSMVYGVTKVPSSRKVIMFYGSRNSEHHAFKQELADISKAHPNVHVINLYSRPLKQDVKGVDYLGDGHVNVELIEAVLPHKNCQFYLCGGPAFMESLYFGLKDWGVDPELIAFEHFGPSTIQPPASATEIEVPERFDPVSFLASDEVAIWEPRYGSLLELAEAHGIEIESGCRSGSCGTCETALVSGKVVYPHGAKPECAPGCCLPCIARPDGEVELEV